MRLSVVIPAYNEADRLPSTLNEIVGYLVAMTAAPKDWVYVVAGFVLFRLFDIAKPWPIRALDRRVSGGLGIMVDDLVAGVLAALVLQVLVMSGLI